MNKELKDRLIGYFQKRHFAISYKELDEIYGLIIQQAVSEQKEKDAQEVELYSIENNDVPIEIGVKNE